MSNIWPLWRRQVPDIDDQVGAEVYPEAAADVVLGELSEEPVDLPSAHRKTRRHARPPWMRSRATLLSEARLGIRYGAQLVRFHLVLMVIRYPWLIIMYIPRGVGRSALWLHRWYWADPNLEVRLALAGASKTGNIRATGELFKSQSARSSALRGRFFMVAAAVVAVVVAVSVVGLVPLAVIAAVGCGFIGSNKPIIPAMIFKDDNPRPTPAMLDKALVAVNIKALTDCVNAGELEYVDELVKDSNGRGWSTRFNMSRGVTWEAVAGRVDRFAAAMRRDRMCIIIKKGSHEGQIDLWVGDERPSAADTPPWPLLGKGVTNVFEPLPLGVDQRLDLVGISMMFASMVVGGISRMGKTAALRLIFVAAAMDPRARLYIANLRGGADWGMFAPIAEYYRTGSSQRDLEALMVMLREIQADVDQRQATIADVPLARCPDGELTDEMASDPELAMWPVFIVLDETQRLFESPVFKKEAIEIVADISKRGPSVGVQLISATQRPDAPALPTAIRDNALLSLCLMVKSPDANNMISGSGAYSAGVDATQFTREDKGLAWLSGEYRDPIVVQMYYLSNLDAARELERAYEARKEAGTLPRELTIDDNEPVGLLEDVLDVWPSARDIEWSETLVRLLAAAYPTYEDLTKTALNAQLRGYGIDPGRQVDIAGQVKRGPSRSAIEAVLAGPSSTPSTPLALADPC
jgi:S-DNA-T family DNA segregation ATPase FtsK/SpoIIIE